ncbi:Phosphoglycolate phosphatase, HAD superfamily [Raineyella antarctica]|uniref:Phosphoglycolate phosphatase, HAD superfamily n=1 Tax=Raineyella antarctica TaxID=1577474 RepID=A0A1G6GFA9_9ACTN|nr:haloacid dehalogenase-like hydrolase [Raineyella antarctica]SDB80698.1 Phosphoglycolate phosphatase, HAD superfamily [Raineyella antarctica]
MGIAVYWDIDGTLLLSPPGRADLFLQAIEGLGGTPVKPAGRREGLTDRRVGELYLEAAGMSLDRLDDYLAELDVRSATYYLEHPRALMPGVHDALADVAARGWRQALMSGNTPSRIRTKLFTAGIDPSTFDMATSVSGGFVSDRRELGGQARERSGDDLLVVVGDTPHDLLAAQAADAVFIGVNADPAVRDELAKSALVVVETLADPAFAAALDRVAGGTGGAATARAAGADQPITPNA